MLNNRKFAALAVSLILIELVIATPSAHAALLLCADPPNCSVCDLISGFDKVKEVFLLWGLIIATLVIVISGGVIIFSPASEELRELGKNMIMSVCIGIVIMFSATILLDAIKEAITNGGFIADPCAARA